LFIYIKKGAQSTGRKWIVLFYIYLFYLGAVWGLKDGVENQDFEYSYSQRDF